MRPQAKINPGLLPTHAHKERASSWFTELRDKICAALEAIEQDYAKQKGGTAGKFERKAWDREVHGAVAVAGSEQRERTAEQSRQNNGGGGVMSVLRGQVFEKGGVNVSAVHGQFSPEFRAQIPGAGTNGNFWASGISLVIHPRNPKVPAVHMNTRHIITSFGWFGGGADLNPVFPQTEDTEAFHAAFKKACDAYAPNAYENYKKWCDEYFFIRHRGRARGVGGIFYDDLDSGDWEHDFAFTQAVGEAFLDIYPKLVRRHMFENYTPEDREAQLIWRGHYAEFNMVYDRGTKFGLMTGGNTEAILMSLPPEAKWP